MPGARGTRGDGLHAHLQRLQMHDVQQAQVRQRGRQKRVLDDFGIRNAHVLHHQEGRGAHHRRHDLAVDRTHGLDGAGLNAPIARLLHQRNGEDAAGHHIGDRRARNHAVERRRHHRHLGRPAAHVAKRRKADLHHVVAAARAIEQRAEQHIDKDGAGRYTQRDAVHALRRQPHVREQAIERCAFVRQHVGQIRPAHAIGQEQQRQRRHRPADGAARGFEQQHQASGGDHDVHRRRLPRARGQLPIEEHQIRTGKGADEGQHPIQRRHVAPRRRAERRPGQKRQRERERQVNRPRLGVVEDAEAQHEGQRRCVPVLEQRPGQRQSEDHLGRGARRFAAAGVGLGNQLLQRFGGFFDVGSHLNTIFLIAACACTACAGSLKHS